MLTKLRRRLYVPPLVKRIVWWLGAIGKIKTTIAITTSVIVTSALAKVAGFVWTMHPVLRWATIVSFAVLLAIFLVAVFRVFTRPPVPKLFVGVSQDIYSLTVTNNGPPAKFRAQLRILERQDFFTIQVKKVLDLFWYSTQGREVEILTGFEEQLAIGALVFPPAAVPMAALAIRHFDPAKKGPDFISSTPYFLNQPGHRPELLLEVILGTVPPHRSSTLNLKFRLTVDGLTDASSAL